MRTAKHSLSREAELAVQRGDLGEALRGFVAAGDRAVAHKLWRSAARYYRGALELDLLRREPVDRLVKVGAQLGTQLEWSAYARVLDDVPQWPHFGCRAAQLLTHDSGSIVECGGVGPVLELMMTRTDFIEVHPDGRFAKMPLAMGLVILRRALWPAPREATLKPSRVEVMFAGRPPAWLDERGDWGLV